MCPPADDKERHLPCLQQPGCGWWMGRCLKSQFTLEVEVVELLPVATLHYSARTRGHPTWGQGNVSLSGQVPVFANFLSSLVTFAGVTETPPLFTSSSGHHPAHPLPSSGPAGLSQGHQTAAVQCLLSPGSYPGVTNVMILSCNCSGSASAN